MDEVEEIIIDVVMRIHDIDEAARQRAIHAVGAFEQSIQHTQSRVAQLSRTMRDDLGSGFNSVRGTLEGLGYGIARSFMMPLENATGLVRRFATTLRDDLGAGFRGVRGNLEEVGQAFARTFRTPLLEAQHAIQSLVRIFEPSVTTIGRLLRGVGSDVSGVVSKLIGGAGGVGGSLLGALGSIGSVISGVGGGAFGVVSSIGGSLFGLFGGLVNVATTAVGSVVNAVGSVANSISNAISSAVGGVLGFATSLPGLIAEAGALYGGVVWPLELAGNLEVATINFESFYGSAEKAHKTIAEIRQLAISTPFRFPELLDLGKVLTVAGVPAERLTFYLRQIGTAALALRPEQREQEFRTLGRAVQQTLTQGFISGYEAREFRHAGIPVEQLLMREFGVDLQARGLDIRSALEQRVLPARRAIRAIFEGISTDPRFQMLPERWAKTFPGQLSVLQDMLETQFVTQYGTGLAKGFEPGLQGIIDYFNQHQDVVDKLNVGLEHLGRTLSGFLVDQVKGVFGFLGDVFASPEFLRSPDLLTALGIAAGRLLDKMGPVGTWLRDAWSVGFPKFTSALQDAWHWLSDPGGAWDKFRGFIGHTGDQNTLIGAVDAAAQHFGLWGDNVKGTQVQAGTLAGTFVSIVDTTKSLAGTLSEIAITLVSWVQSLYDFQKSTTAIANDIHNMVADFVLAQVRAGVGVTPGTEVPTYPPGDAPGSGENSNENTSGGPGGGFDNATGRPYFPHVGPITTGAQRGPAGSLAIAQFGQALRASGFNEETIAAACGPIAAAGVARAFGMRNADAATFLRDAPRYGWSTAGMGGYENFRRLLQGEAGIGSTVVGQQAALSALGQGSPIVISTPKHYFLAQGFGPNGTIDTGETGKVFRGGGRYLTIDQIAALGGGINAFIQPQARRQATAGGGFISSLRASAGAVQERTGIPAEALLAIAANETGFGQAGMQGNVMYGVKWTSGSPFSHARMGTWESIGGQRVNTSSEFETYQSPYEAMLGFAAFLGRNPRYAPALDYLRTHPGDAGGFVDMLARAGYATDPQWSGKIRSLIGRVRGMQGGGVINEPVIGIGRSGSLYSFAESGPERVGGSNGGDVYNITVPISGMGKNAEQLGLEVARVIARELSHIKHNVVAVPGGL